jgi:ketosteroid isomerase-like protein
MKRSILALFIPFIFTVPAAAEDMKEVFTKIASSYQGCYTKQDPACVAALYTKDGAFINSAGKQDPLTVYTNTFKAGFNKLDISVDETWQIDEDTPAAVGKFHISGKNDKGEAVDAEGVWSAAYVKQDGDWKIRMLTASHQVKPPPAK